MSARGEIAEVRFRPAICEAVEKAAASLDFTGVRALRVLLHAGVSAYWPMVKAAPTKQVKAYEATVNALRERWDVPPDCAPDPSARAMFRDMDAEVAWFLDLCAARSGTQWLEPVESIAAYAAAMLQGTVLRWLADCDDETALVVLDDLVSGLAGRATDAY
ncbi:TetR family transcriptional regulator [Nocardia sp. NBC_01377]|uniref:TetR family transcriptional regulator n=1 Tax=Nocardia sp. NBC_01377 TaxID=2903595 RepID=UPI003250CCF6